MPTPRLGLLARLLSHLLGGLGIVCFYCSFSIPAAGGDAFVMLFLATGIVFLVPR